MTSLMEPVRAKLDEAKYFLQQMESASAPHQRFKYNLSAFLSASRSVPQILLACYGAKSGFQAWYDKEMGNPLLAFFRDRRNESVHEGPVPLDTELETGNTVAEASLIEKVGDTYTVRASASGTSATEFDYIAMRLPWGTEFGIYANFRWVFDGFPNNLPHKNDVLGLCGLLVDELENLVADAETRFGI